MNSQIAQLASTKRVFISYSHDSEAHKQWVRGLAEFLMKNGIEVILDQWNLDYGDDLAAFMEGAITDSDRVLVICTDNYLSKADAGSGGVGYEKTIATAEILSDHKQRRKFIPIVRGVTGKRKLPSFLGAALYLDMSGSNDNNILRDELVRRLWEIPLQKPQLGSSPFVPDLPPAHAGNPPHTGQPLALAVRDSCDLFASRFGQAFPGVRGVAWFTDAATIKDRFEKLFAPPLVFKGGGHLAWWWRGHRNLQIENFEHVEGSHFVMDGYELNIKRIAAANPGQYYQTFVYIETIADPPTGLYDSSPDLLAKEVQDFGYAWEEYGLVDDLLPVTRAEYDDGAAIIDDKPVDIRGRVEIRTRHLTPYNLIVAPQMSPINNHDFDSALQAYLDRMLRGEELLESTIFPAIRRLPKKN